MITPKEKRYQLFDAKHNCYIRCCDRLIVVYNKGYINCDLIKTLSDSSEIKKIEIYLDSVEKFNKLCDGMCIRFYKDKPVNIIFKHINMENKTDELEGLKYDDDKTVLKTKGITDNVKISYKKIKDYCVTKRQVELSDTERLSIDPWLVNIGNTTFDKFVSKMDEDSKRYALFLRLITKTVYTQLKHKYKNLDEMNETEKMKVVSEYVDSIIDICDKDDLSSDPVSTYIRKKGDTYGRSKLIQLLSNNRYLKVKSYCVKGSHDHYWNEFIDENGQVVELDLSDLLMPISSIKNSTKLILQHSPQIYDKIS